MKFISTRHGRFPISKEEAKPELFLPCGGGRRRFKRKGYRKAGLQIVKNPTEGKKGEKQRDVVARPLSSRSPPRRVKR